MSHKKRLTLSPEETAMLKRRGYKITSYLGRGGFGTVYNGTWNGDRPIAIKQVELLTDSLKDRTMLVLAEMMALKSIRHPHAVQVLDFFLVQGEYLLIFMEFLGGGDLMSSQLYPCFDEILVAWYYNQFGSALAYMHQRGLAHRDLKPANILLSEDKLTTKLADYGLVVECYDRETGQPLKHSACSGTAYYMSPELIMIAAQNKDKTLGRSQPYCPFLADVWAMGIILYGMLHGSNRMYPYEKPNPWDFDEAYYAMLKMYLRIPGQPWVLMAKFDDDRISHSAQHFTRRHLEWNPTDRPEMDDLLNDRWLVLKAAEAKRRFEEEE